MAIKNVNKTINYVGKDFGQLKQNLIDFTKTYFPNSYSDFNESSPGMVFVEQAAAIGDILSFYQDVQLKESMLAHATERKNVVALAQTMGYKPKAGRSIRITRFSFFNTAVHASKVCRLEPVP